MRGGILIVLLTLAWTFMRPVGPNAWKLTAIQAA